MSAKDSQSHEAFYINNTKTMLVRQDRIECDPTRHSLIIDKHFACGVINMSSFGIAVESKEILKDEYIDTEFQVDGYSIMNLSIKKVREHKNQFGEYNTAYIILGAPLNVEAAIAIKSLNEILSSRSETALLEKQLNEDFRLVVLEVKDMLSKLESDINQLEKDSFKYEQSDIEVWENSIANRMAKYFADSMTPYYQQISKILANIPKEEIGKYFEYFRNALGGVLYKSAYAHRAYYKPKGYAGDYEMMNHVYKRELRGENLFAKCLQRYFVDEPAGVAVRNREEYLRQKIKNTMKRTAGKCKILSVASGPAMEIQKLTLESGVDLGNVEFHLLDQDLDALKHAQRKIEASARENNKRINIKLHNLAIKNVISEGLPMKDFDLIYSAGLFDYFTDPVAAFGGRQLFNSLKNDGQLIIGNFSLDNPNQFAMGLIMDWNLIYRSPEKLKNLFSTFATKIEIEQENKGINLFAVIDK